MRPAIGFGAWIAAAFLVWIPSTRAIVPASPDLRMALEAPRECLAYFATSGFAQPNPQSANETERLFAEPDVQRLFDQIDKALVKACTTPRPGAPPVMKHVPDLVKTLLTRPLAIHITRFQLRPGGKGIEADMLVNLGHRLDSTRAALAALREMLPPGSVSTIPAGKDTYYKFEIPGQPAVAWAIDGTYLRIAVGDDAANRLLVTPSDRLPAWLTTVHKQLPVPRVGTTLYVNVPKVLEAAEAAAGPDFVANLRRFGLEQIKYYAAVTGLDDKGYVSKSIVAMTAPSAGLFGETNVKPLRAEDFALIPADTPLAAVARFDADAAFARLIQAIGQAIPQAPEMIDAHLRQMQRQFGIDVRRDILQTLGDSWQVHIGPGGGMLLVPGLTASVSLRDPQRFAATHDKLLTLANAAIAQSFSGPSDRRPPQIRHLSVAGRKVYYVNDIAPGFPLAPAWCVTDTHLIVGLFPQSVTTVLARPAGAKSLATRPEIAEVLREKNPVLALSYHDAPRLWEQFYPVLQLLAQTGLSMARQGGPIARLDLDFDITMLPSAASVGRHLRPGVAVLQSSPEGLVSTRRQSLPGGGPTDPTTLGFAAALIFPAISQTMESVRSNQSAAQMRSILTAIAVSRTQNGGRFPKAFTTDKAGKPLLSWRVQMLPLLDEKALYDRFHHDEPWDSPHNKTLIARMPKAYRSPRSQAAEGKTTFFAVRGKNAVFVDGKTQRTAIHDGESRTAMLVEVDDDHAVTWTQPDDYDVDATTPLNKPFSGLRRVNFGFADGHIAAVSPTIDTDVLKALFTVNGRELIDSEGVP